MSRRSSYQANRDSVDNDDEDAAFLTHAAPPAGHSHRPQQHRKTDLGKSIKDNEYGHGRLATGQRGSTTATADEISVATAIDTLSLPASNKTTEAAALSPLSSTPGPHHPQEPTYSKWSTIIHQLSFLGTGIFSTIAVQWLYYQGAAFKPYLLNTCFSEALANLTSGSTMLTVFFNYIGMMSVGLVYAFQSWYADRKQRRLAATAGGGRTHVEYDVLMTEVTDMTETRKHDNQGIIKGSIDTVANRLSRSRKSLEEETHVLGPIDDEEEDFDDEEDEVDEEKQTLRKEHRPSASEPSSVKNNTATQASKSSLTRSLHWPVIQVAVMDVIANAMVTVGFFYVGSGLNNIQWVAIVGVTIGLAISAVGTVQDASPDGPVQSWIEKSFGALITLGATFLYSCVYVLSDKVLSTFKPTPIPEKVCSMVGGYASLFTFLYLCVHTFPNWKAEVMDVVAERQGSGIGILLVYPLLVISSLLHSLNYYVLLSRINNIAVGIMQSLRAVLVFVMSHYLFCGVSATQCFNQWKFLSAIVVIGCVTLFSFNSQPSAAANKVEAPEGPALANVRATTSISRTSSPIPRHRKGQTSSESP
ncbi:hypothetical protein BGX23_007866 [Mortierella sp. AD031]|nr:hypothetical protein BGX23_007866 [Mortierella sp. AD031]